MLDSLVLGIRISEAARKLNNLLDRGLYSVVFAILFSLKFGLIQFH